MRVLLSFAMMWLSCAVNAQDIFVLGEVHDNPAHHVEQARRVVEISPDALVFEMLSADQAAAVTAENRHDQQKLANVLGWEKSGWPSFSMYFPIFEAAPQAEVYGAAVDRTAAMAAMEGGFDGPMEGQAARYGLNDPLPEVQQAKRESLQMAAHCDAMPEEMLPGMVRIQRLRDAVLARTAVEAHVRTGGPVVVITGNGHARKDWGIPAALRLAAPELDVFALGQGEDGVPPDGGFDAIVDAPAPQRGDPCAAFR